VNTKESEQEGKRTRKKVKALKQIDEEKWAGARARTNQNRSKGKNTPKHEQGHEQTGI
jgi:hypothetical protein